MSEDKEYEKECEAFWDTVLCLTEQEIINRYGQEYFDKITKIVKYQDEVVSKMPEEEKRKRVVDFIMYGPGGD
jgi:phosphoenolpyruvate carboxylase